MGKAHRVGDRRPAVQHQVVALRRRGQGRRRQGAVEGDRRRVRGVRQDHAGPRRHRAAEGRAVAVGHRQGRQRGPRADRAAGGDRPARAGVQAQALRVGQRAIHRPAQGDARPRRRAAIVRGVNDRGGARQRQRRVAIAQRDRVARGAHGAVQGHARGIGGGEPAVEQQHVGRVIAQRQRAGVGKAHRVGDRRPAVQHQVVALRRRGQGRCAYVSIERKRRRRLEVQRAGRNSTAGANGLRGSRSAAIRCRGERNASGRCQGRQGNCAGCVISVWSIAIGKSYRAATCVDGCSACHRDRGVAGIAICGLGSGMVGNRSEVTAVGRNVGVDCNRPPGM